MLYYNHVDLPETSAYYTAYIYDKSPEYPYNDKRAAVVLCPGGGYEMTSDREAEPMALKYFAAGFNVFIIRYRCGEIATWPNPQCDALKALKDIRLNAEKYNIFEDKIALGGFSAGGHLAASIGVHWNNKELCDAAGVKPCEVKPNALLLYYPVIKAYELTHQGTIDRMLFTHAGDEKTKELVSLEKQVTKDTPPTFIGHTYEDQAVPVVNALDFARALYLNGVACELHVCEKGHHGLATGDRNTNGALFDGAIDWTVKAISWLKNKFEFLN